MFQNRKLIAVLIVLLACTGSMLLLENCSTHQTEEKGVQNVLSYMGDTSCKSCHATEHEAWKLSDHFKAMQLPDDSTVLGDFNNVSYNSDGVTSRFFKRDNNYFINTQGEDGLNHDYEVKYTFGYHPLQQYLVELPGGKLQVPRVSWDTKAKKWFHQYPGTTIPNHDWMHWSGNSQNWNTMCASCHSTNVVKNYNIEHDTYHTTFDAINVSCESCHGPASKHIAYIKSNKYKVDPNVMGSFLALGKSANQKEIINTCGLCHSRKADITGAVLPGKEFMDDFIPQIPDTELFHADGQMKGEVYNYSSFLESKMYRRNVSCTNCHNPHSGNLVKPGNLVCGQCHEAKKFDVPEHTFHKAGSEASECKSCHMYSKEYMVNDLRHDHSFRVPRPDLTVKYGTPNTCNGCHKDKSAQWAVTSIEKNYGATRKYHFAEDLIPGSKMDANSFRHLQKLLQDTAVGFIVKATAAEYVGKLNTAESLHELLNCLSKKDALVRYQALRSLEHFQFSSWISQVAELLNDSVRAVRIAAANLMISIPTNQIPPAALPSLFKAKSELERFTLYQTDFAQGNVGAGDYYSKIRDYYKAEMFYKKALEMDGMLNYARLNMSAVLSAQGKNIEALKTLNEALIIDKSDNRIYYNMALLQVELNNIQGAVESFEEAVKLNSQNPRLYYNYGLLLNNENNFKRAEQIFLKGLQLDPINGDLNYALALLYVNNQKNDKATKPIQLLLKYYPNNPDYSTFLNRFKQISKK